MQTGSVSIDKVLSAAIYILEGHIAIRCPERHFEGISPPDLTDVNISLRVALEMDLPNDIEDHLRCAEQSLPQAKVSSDPQHVRALHAALCAARERLRVTP